MKARQWFLILGLAFLVTGAGGWATTAQATCADLYCKDDCPTTSNLPCNGTCNMAGNLCNTCTACAENDDSTGCDCS